MRKEYNSEKGRLKLLKGIVHPKIKMMSSLTHPQVVANLYECVCSAEHKGRYSEECGKQSSSGAPLTSIVFFLPTMEVNVAPKQPGYKLSSKYLPLCLEKQRNSYRFGNTRGWVNYRILISLKLIWYFLLLNVELIYIVLLYHSLILLVEQVTFFIFFD